MSADLEQYRDSDGNIHLDQLPPELRDTVQKDLTKLREEECVPVAQGIIKLIAEHLPELLMGQYSKDEQIANSKQFFMNVIEPFLREKNVKVHDLAFIFALVLQPVENTKLTTVDSMNDAVDAAVTKLFGKSEQDLRVSDIIKVQGGDNSTTTEEAK